ncbi:MAG: hypothetical protein JWM80_5786 [Cyanobacteria bacterium RYN_339]|nr:hypothetical protein [Cyanobacteria bacterium RYN_339]
MSNEKLARYVEARCEALGRDRSEIETAAKLGNGWLGHLERGTLVGRPTPTTLEHLAQGLVGAGGEYRRERDRLMRAAGYLGDEASTSLELLLEEVDRPDQQPGPESPLYALRKPRRAVSDTREVGVYALPTAKGFELFHRDNRVNTLPLPPWAAAEVDVVLEVRVDEIPSMGLSRGNLIALQRLRSEAGEPIKGREPRDGDELVVVDRRTGLPSLRHYRKEGEAALLLGLPTTHTNAKTSHSHSWPVLPGDVHLEGRVVWVWTQVVRTT